VGKGGKKSFNPAPGSKNRFSFSKKFFFPGLIRAPGVLGVCQPPVRTARGKKKKNLWRGAAECSARKPAFEPIFHRGGGKPKGPVFFFSEGGKEKKTVIPGGAVVLTGPPMGEMFGRGPPAEKPIQELGRGDPAGV